MLVRAKQDLASGLTYLATMNRLFDADTQRDLALAQSVLRELDAGKASYHDVAFQFRALLRTFFAQVEGTTYILRQMALWAHDRSEIALSNEELYRLSEGERGEFPSSRRYNSLTENVGLSVLLLRPPLRQPLQAG